MQTLQKRSLITQSTSLLKRFTSIALPLLAAITPLSSHAGAWTLDEGKFKLIPTYNYYFSDKNFDSTGNVLQSKKFIKNELSINMEYGISPELTVGGTPYFTTLNAPRSHQDNRNEALSAADIYARYRLVNSESFVLSIEPKLKLPGIYDPSATPSMGPRTTDFELATGIGTNYTLFGMSGFTDTRLAYGNYVDKLFSLNANPYIQADFTVALEFLPSWFVMPKLYNHFSLNDTAPTNISGANLVNSKNYTLVKPELNIVKRFTPEAAIQVGGYQDIYGQNTGKGRGITTSLWLDF